ncbi:MAG TPA: hypothetical protein VMR16_03090 [Candidatus Saccharimonadales bacterium]|nr:hypothetical protein [Candidatus Saccharimonadales bacterium]
MGFLGINTAEKRAIIRLIIYKRYEITPSSEIYAKIKIAKIPNGPAVTGVVIFNKITTKQILIKVIIEIIIFIIL